LSARATLVGSPDEPCPAQAHDLGRVPRLGGAPGAQHEFDGIRPVAMVGVTAAHSSIQGNLAASLIPKLRGKPCRFMDRS
jgi:hypothetical protein